MNGAAYCPDSYKESVIKNLLARAYGLSEDWSKFHTEVERLKILLINNNYTNTIVDSVVKRFVHKKTSGGPENTPSDEVKTINIRYCAQMHDNYRLDERVLRQIITSCVKVNDRRRHRLSFSVYYKNKKSHNLIMKNSPRHTSILQSTNVVYKFTCPAQHDVIATYIGQTRTTLSRRITMHLQGGSISAHSQLSHGTKLTRQTLVDNTVILHHEADPSRLKIAEALYIVRDKPMINVQDDHFGRILRLFNNASHLQRYGATAPQDSSSIVALESSSVNLKHIPRLSTSDLSVLRTRSPLSEITKVPRSDQDYLHALYRGAPNCGPSSCLQSTTAVGIKNPDLIEQCSTDLLTMRRSPSSLHTANVSEDLPYTAAANSLSVVRILTSSIHDPSVTEQFSSDPLATCRPYSGPVSGGTPQTSHITALLHSPSVGLEHTPWLPTTYSLRTDDIYEDPVPIDMVTFSHLVQNVTIRRR